MYAHSSDLPIKVVTYLVLSLVPFLLSILDIGLHEKTIIKKAV
jgi:hypothetical protein